MALPLLAIAQAVRILGPAAAKAAKLAYKMYKKKGGNKTEKKFLSDKANQVLKTETKQIKGMTKAELERQRKKIGNTYSYGVKNQGQTNIQAKKSFFKDKGRNKKLLKDVGKKVKKSMLRDFDE